MTNARRHDAGVPVLNEATYVLTCARQLRDDLVPLSLAGAAALAVSSPWLLAVALGATAFVPLLCAVFGASAWTALVFVAAQLALGQPVSARVTMKEAVRLFPRSAPLGAATAGFAWAFERALSAAAEDGGIFVVLAGITGAGAILLLTVDLHAFPLLALHNMPLRDAARTGLALAMASPAATAGLLGAATLALLELAWLGPGTLLVSTPTLAVLMVNNTRVQIATLGLSWEVSD